MMIIHSNDMYIKYMYAIRMIRTHVIRSNIRINRLIMMMTRIMNIRMIGICNIMYLPDWKFFDYLIGLIGDSAL